MKNFERISSSWGKEYAIQCIYEKDSSKLFIIGKIQNLEPGYHKMMFQTGTNTYIPMEDIYVKPDGCGRIIGQIENYCDSSVNGCILLIDKSTKDIGIDDMNMVTDMFCEISLHDTIRTPCHASFLQYWSGYDADIEYEGTYLY